MCERELAISIHCNLREQNESAKVESMDEEKDEWIKTGRLSGRMADGWCKGERNKKMNKECYRTALHNIQSSDGPLKQQGDETSYACWQWDSTGALQR